MANTTTYEARQIESTIQLEQVLDTQGLITLYFPNQPIAHRVFMCESGLQQEAISHTRDFGVGQINEKTWDTKAKELGLDYKNSELDNIRMARYIYDDANGWSPWVCFRKI